MSVRSRLFSSTFLTGLATILFGVAAATAGSIPPGQLPAVDGVNGTGAIQGGGDDTKSLFAGTGSLAVPLGTQYGAEFDGMAAASTTGFSAAARRTCSGATRRRGCSAPMAMACIGIRR